MSPSSGSLRRSSATSMDLHDPSRLTRTLGLAWNGRLHDRLIAPAPRTTTESDYTLTGRPSRTRPAKAGCWGMLWCPFVTTVSTGDSSEFPKKRCDKPPPTLRQQLDARRISVGTPIGQDRHSVDRAKEQHRFDEGCLVRAGLDCVQTSTCAVVGLARTRSPKSLVGGPASVLRLEVLTVHR